MDLKLIEKEGPLRNLCFAITKQVAETDSIGEGWSYCTDYTLENFNKEIQNIKEDYGLSGNYLYNAGLPILELVLKEF